MTRRLLLPVFMLLSLDGGPARAEEDLGPYREQLHEILGRREFRAQIRELGLDPERPFGDWEPPSAVQWLEKQIERFFRWLGDSLKGVVERFFDWLRARLPQGPRGVPDTIVPALSRLAVWGLAIFAWWLLVYVIYRYLVGHKEVQRAAQARESAPSPSLDALSRPIEEWKLAAEEHVGKGEWRLALRATYLAILSMLHQRRVIHYSREKTNGEFISYLAGRPAQKAFTSLTFLFDEAWYGSRTFAEADYGHALAFAQDVDNLSRTEAGKT